MLKPGGHVAAFGSSRGYHRMTCAIEDAGFEIRDSLMWVYGSGFPKSHDVAKNIDKRGGKQVGWFGLWLKQWREQNAIKQSEVAALFPSRTGRKTGCVANWELGFNLPTPEQFNAICQRFDLPFDSLEAAEREVIGQQSATLLAVAPGQDNDRSATTLDITAPATDAARQWDGWGTALKPAFEPITLARKPLSEGTVAANVLRWGTGALNIGGCRVGRENMNGGTYGMRCTMVTGFFDGQKRRSENLSTLGRWPANVSHDGSDEVVGAFPDESARFFASFSQAVHCGLCGMPYSATCTANIAKNNSTIHATETGNSVQCDVAASGLRGNVASVLPLNDPGDQCGNQFKAMPLAERQFCSVECGAFAARKRSSKMFWMRRACAAHAQWILLTLLSR